MEFEERFPRTGKTIRVVGATVVPMVLMLVPFSYIVGGWELYAEPGDLERFALDRAVYVLVAVSLAAGIGAFGGEIAFPHSALVPALLVATVTATAGMTWLIPEVLETGDIPLDSFTYGLLGPPAHVLGALLRQRWRHGRQATLARNEQVSSSPPPNTR